MSQHYQMYIDGQWCDSESNNTYDAMNPGKGEVFGTIPEGTRADAQRAVAAANKAFETWRKVPLWERSAMCVKIADAIDENVEELADTLCTELGKPRHQEAAWEAGEASVPWRIAAEQAKYFEGHTMPCATDYMRVTTWWQPRGVVTAITPWNFPAAIPGEYLPFAIVMGNAVCWTPAPTAAATACVLAKAFEKAELPAGVINLITGPGAEVGDELVVNPGTNAVGMTGSPQTAKIITSRAGLKPRLFELGGNGPVVILPDADPKGIAASIASACFFAAGQVCSCAERIFVADNLKQEFVDAMVAQTERWIPGDPLDEKTTMGSQNNMGVVEKMGAHLEDAKKNGATVVAGGNRPDLPGFFWEPTVITDFAIDSLVNHEETFGPIAPINSFSSDDQAWQYIKACNLGLVSAVFTQNVTKAWQWAEELDTGITVVNDYTHFWEHHLPFGGTSRNDSGLGRIGGRHTLEFMSNLKSICFNVAGPTSFLPEEN